MIVVSNNCSVSNEPNKEQRKVESTINIESYQQKDMRKEIEKVVDVQGHRKIVLSRGTPI